MTAAAQISSRFLPFLVLFTLLAAGCTTLKPLELPPEYTAPTETMEDGFFSHLPIEAEL